MDSGIASKNPLESFCRGPKPVTWKLMIRKAIEMPWYGNSVPHGVLDVMRGCNISCRGCYNGRASGIKSPEQVKQELELMLSMRQLHTITLSGGEPALHPDIFEIIRYVRSRNLRVGMLTNGVLIDSEFVRRGRDVGLDLILFHIQSGQQRPDLPTNPDFVQLRKLRDAKGKIVVDGGLTPGLSMIAYRRELQEVRETVSEVLVSPYFNFLLVTGYADIASYGAVSGDIYSGMNTDQPVFTPNVNEHPDHVKQSHFIELLTSMGLEPFGFVGSSVDANNPRWLLYSVATVRNHDGSTIVESLVPGIFDRLIIHATRLVLGRNVFFYKSYSSAFVFRLIVNALTGGRFYQNLSILLKCCKRGAMLVDKHMAFQQAPDICPDGRIVICRDCPDATILNGKMVPLCLSDMIVERNRTMYRA